EHDTRRHFPGAAAVKCVQITDLHLNALMPFHREFIRRINAIRPDFIFFTGDMIDRRKNLSLLEEFLENFDPQSAKAAILGNWEHWGKVETGEMRDLYERFGIDLIVNDAKIYSVGEKRILISGVDDFISGDPDIQKALSAYQPNDFHIVLSHCPGYVDMIRQAIAPAKKADLILSGHTHGGQISLFGFVPILPVGSGGYVKGWYPHPAGPLYVSRGIGTTIVPLRFSAQAEISIFNLYL
ncbi:MAG TPA: metallophosphoesterase, partial [Flavobacteriales bacterium]|nr:metallophosphoesterase [Flavobacteriales bacterium]